MTILDEEVYFPFEHIVEFWNKFQTYPLILSFCFMLVRNDTENIGFLC